MNETEQYWGFSGNPFSIDVENWLFLGSAQRTTLAQLGSLVSSKPAVISLVAPPSHGATTLLKHFSMFSGIDDLPIQCVWLGTKELSLLMRHSAQRADILANLQSFTDDGIQSVWICDRYHSTVLRAIHQLSSVIGLTFVIAMRPDDFERSEIHLGRIPPSVDLQRLSLTDTRQFIEQSIQRVDGKGSVFSEAAIERLHVKTNGRIGEVAALAAASLVVAAREHSSEVTARMIEHSSRGSNQSQGSSSFVFNRASGIPHFPNPTRRRGVAA